MTGFTGGESRLHVAVHGDGDRITVTLTGELDGFNGAQLTRVLNTAMDGCGEHLDLQIGQLWFVDVGGARVLLHAYHRGADRGVTVRVRNPLPHIVWLLQTLGDAAVLLDDHMTPCSDRLPPAVSAGEPADETPPVRLAAAAEARDRRADERDRRADQRDERADDRDRLAQERDRLVDERQQRVSEHQRWADIREDLADARERALEHREEDC